MTENQQKLMRYARIPLDMDYSNSEITLSVLTNVVESAAVIIGDISKAEIDAVVKQLESLYAVKSSAVRCISDNYEDSQWYTNIKNSLENLHWNKYKNYLIDAKNFAPNIVSQLSDETLDKYLMNHLGNPNADYSFLKRGLVIGDVQSGKTSTFIGLISKAADAGYKFIIVLTGVIEDLRSQTQERIEEGFIGTDAIQHNKHVGVGSTPDTYVRSLTTRQHDFGNNTRFTTTNFTEPTIMIVKKNTTTLTNILNWLENAKASKIPMLIIDDEADNASINTKDSKENPTVINKSIRKILDSFEKANYVGFTATPYANVFIDPEKDEEMENQDLFPEDFIVSLPTPNNYIGAEAIFFEDSKYNKQLRYINDAGDIEDDGFDFYLSHKKEWDGDMPDSLVDAIYAFYLTNVIRDIRGDVNDHRSMLVNVSRFTNVQQNVMRFIEEIHKKAYSAIKFYAHKTGNDIINRIKLIWNQEYSNLHIEWNDVADKLFDSIKDIKIKVVNSKKTDKLSYDTKESVRVIAIGGLALSRGLTLEGLVISYFYRNTSTYDVLMQMGRWFGYRKGYDDVFRVWIRSDSAEWYKEIAEAAKQLREDMDRMARLKKKPKEFGIRIRHDCKRLGITARNKMRNSEQQIEHVHYNGKFVETPYVSAKVEIQKMNYNQVAKLINNIHEESTFEKKNGSSETLFAKDISVNTIKGFLDNVNIPTFNRFDLENILDFISGTNYENFDVVFLSGNSEFDDKYLSSDNNKFKYSIRGNCTIKGDSILHLSSRAKLSGTTDGRYGLTSKQEDEVKLKYQQDKNTDSISVEAWFSHCTNRNPLLAIYLIEINHAENDLNAKKLKDDLKDIPVVGIGIGFPNVEGTSIGHLKTYQVNAKYNYFDIPNDDVEEE